MVYIYGVWGRFLVLAAHALGVAASQMAFMVLFLCIVVMPVCDIRMVYHGTWAARDRIFMLKRVVSAHGTDAAQQESGTSICGASIWLGKAAAINWIHSLESSVVHKVWIYFQPWLLAKISHELMRISNLERVMLTSGRGLSVDQYLKDVRIIDLSSVWVVSSKILLCPGWIYTHRTGGLNRINSNNAS